MRVVCLYGSYKKVLVVPVTEAQAEYGELVRSRLHSEGFYVDLAPTNKV